MLLWIRVATFFNSCCFELSTSRKLGIPAERGEGEEEHSPPIVPMALSSEPGTALPVQRRRAIRAGGEERERNANELQVASRAGWTCGLPFRIRGQLCYQDPGQRA